VRGNNDDERWADNLRETELIRLGGVFVYVIHDLAKLNVDPTALGIRAVICGHSHKPLIDERAGILYINPGSCGPKRFKLPVSVGELLVEGENVRARIVELSA
jgi:putative phosphoesterase